MLCNKPLQKYMKQTYRRTIGNCCIEPLFAQEHQIQRRWLSEKPLGERKMFSPKRVKKLQVKTESDHS